MKVPCVFCIQAAEMIAFNYATNDRSILFCLIQYRLYLSETKAEIGWSSCPLSSQCIYK